MNKTHYARLLSETYRTVTESNSSSKLDEVTSADGVVLLHEGNEVVDGVVDTVVGLEVGLDGREEQHGAVSTSATREQIFVRIQYNDLRCKYLRLGTLALGDRNGVVWYIRQHNVSPDMQYKY